MLLLVITAAGRRNAYSGTQASVNGGTATITVDLSAHYGWSYEVVFGK